MPSIDDVFSSKYLKSSDLKNQEHTVTIISAEPIILGQGARAQKKILMGFKEMEKQYAAGKLVSKTIAKLHGEDYLGWIGKRITLYVDHEVNFSGDIVDGIRVRSQPGGNGVPSQAKYSQATTSMADWVAFADSVSEAVGKDKYFRILGAAGFEHAGQAGFDDQQRMVAMQWLFDMDAAKKQGIIKKHGDLLRKLNIIHA